MTYDEAMYWLRQRGGSLRVWESDDGDQVEARAEGVSIILKVNAATNASHVRQRALEAIVDLKELLESKRDG